MAKTNIPRGTYPGVNIVTSKKDGRTRVYHRKTRIRIDAPIGSPEFKAEVDRLNQTGRPEPLRGTLAGLFDLYRRSDAFKNLSMRTRKDYEKIFLFLRPGAERKLLLSFRVRDAIEIRDAAAKKHKRHFANYCIVVLRLVLNWGATNGHLDHNPLVEKRLKIKRPHGTPKANRAWADFECEAVLEAASGGVLVAIALGMFTGMREGDVLRATRVNYDGARLTWVQGKTGTPIRLPVAPRLREIIDQSLQGRGADDALTLVVNQKGQSYTPDGFRTMLWKLLHKLELSGAVVPGLTFHGLRHTAGSALADLGASPHEIAAMLGQKTLAMATLYSAEANRNKLGETAINRLIAAASVKGGQNDA